MPIPVTNHTNGSRLARTLALAESAILPRPLSAEAPPLDPPPGSSLRVGVDLGTAYLVLVVLDEQGVPLAGEWQAAQVVRDGLMVDFAGATRLLPVVRPVMEKVGSIILRHVSGRDVRSITLVGGSSAFYGMAQVIQEYTGIPASLPGNPLFVTPLGLALHDRPA